MQIEIFLNYFLILCQNLINTQIKMMQKMEMKIMITKKFYMIKIRKISTKIPQN